MVRLTRILKDYREAGTLSGLIALWGFIDTGAPRSQEQGDAVFLTKAGAVGIAYRLTPPDTECAGEGERAATAARVAQALKHLGERVHLHTYLLTRPRSLPLPRSTRKRSSTPPRRNGPALRTAQPARRTDSR